MTPVRSWRDVAFLGFALAGMALLVWLGWWQVERLQWKTALIAQMEERAAGEPRALAEVAARQADGEDIAFIRTTASGEFLHDRELFVLATSAGVVGWRVVTPLALEDGGTVLVDRGFIPHEFKDAAHRPGSQPAGEIAITGVVRPEAQGQAPFTPDNDPAANVWHWWAVPEMAEAAGLDDAAPFVIQAEPSPGDAAWPRATRVDPASVSNRHLGYALTWFGLAAVLAAMTGLYLFRARHATLSGA